MLTALQHIVANLGFHEDVTVFIVLLGLIFARLVGAVSLSPFLGGKSTSSRIKVGLAFLISFLLFPSVAPQTNLEEFNVMRVVALLIKEAAVGAILGFLSQIVFQSVQMAGATMDYARGMSQATFFAPQLETNVSLIGQLQLQAALVLFLLLNGHVLYLRALAASFQTLPILAFPQFTGGARPGVEQMARYTAESLKISVELSAPVLLALFLVDVSFGIIGKVASGINVHNESQPVKALLGLGIFLLALSYVLGRMPVLFVGMLRQLEQFMRNIS
jgi:flagellar biosynthesis protein FliR